jgi:hypothetical protein
VRLWRERYWEGGVAGLGNLHRSGRPAVHDETSIIAMTLEARPDRLGVTHWSARRLAEHLRINLPTASTQDDTRVNGQVEVPAGGQVKVPTPCGCSRR